MSKLEAKNTFYNDPRYDVVVDSRMLEQHLKEKDQQITELRKQLADKKRELKVLRILYDIVNNPKRDAMLKQIQGLQKKLDIKGQQIKKLQNQLKAQPSDIIKKIKKEFQKHLIDWYEDEENTNSELYLDADWVWEILDTILKEYQK